MKLHIAGFISLILLTGLTFVSPQKVSAAQFSAKDTYLLPKEATVSGSLFVSGQTIDIQGHVTGDVFCGAQQVSVSGVVEGDLLCAAQMITISGTIGGNTRTMSQTIDITGRIARNTNTLAQTIRVGQSASVSGELYAAGQSVSQQGFIGRDLFIGSQKADISGVVAGNTEINAEEIMLTDRAKLLGNFTYSSDSDLNQDEGASISGQVVRKPRETEGKSRSAAAKILPTRKPWWLGSIWGLVTNLILGLLFAALAPGVVNRLALTIEKTPGRSFGFGCLTFIVLPIALVLIAVTLIGIPVAILGGLLFALVVAVSRLFVALIIGKRLVERFMPDKKDSILWQIGVGILASWLIFSLPVAGKILSFLAVLFGTGAVIVNLPPFKTTEVKAKK